MAHQAYRKARLTLEALETRDVPTSGLCPSSVVAPKLAAALVSAKTAQATALALTSAQHLRADRLISTFENSTTVLQYSYVENIHDGRGYTAGRAGFTTATGDVLLVVERYTKKLPVNGLAKFLPRLRQLAKAHSSATTGLSGFATAWRTAAKTSVFRAVQDQIVSETYFQPALLRARGVGAKDALTVVALYDTILQHGEGDDPDGLPAIIRRTNTAAHGTPKTGMPEKTWLLAFLAQRLKTLNNPANAETRDGWRASVDRVRVLRSFVWAGNRTFHGPLHYTVYGDPFTVP